MKLTNINESEGAEVESGTVPINMSQGEKKCPTRVVGPASESMEISFTTEMEDSVDIERSESQGEVMEKEEKTLVSTTQGMSFGDHKPGSVIESDGVKMVVLGPNETSCHRTRDSDDAPSTSLESCTLSELSNDLLGNKEKSTSGQYLTSRASVSCEDSGEDGPTLAKDIAPLIPCSMGMPKKEYFPGDRITIWNTEEKRKVAGNAAPLFKNLVEFFSTHKKCEVYNGQDYINRKSPPRKRNRSKPTRTISKNGEHVAIWNKKERRKIAGNAAPLRKNLDAFLKKRPDCEMYIGQDLNASGEKISIRTKSKGKTPKKQYVREMPELSLSTMMYTEGWYPNHSEHEEELGLRIDSFQSILQLIGDGDNVVENTREAPISSLLPQVISPIEPLGDGVEELCDVDTVTQAMDTGGFSTVRMIQT